ncbi:M50 family metallopeptidase [Sediminibacillus massiliensis]|uniref:M50 family metallopeptidase n=1 Tax=Sediminibacillus massiliensis TaxID=1926277 RepID=UPI00098847A5|nr:M50 family metallopeptidase [Sediminibacillus massiliensis]
MEAIFYFLAALILINMPVIGPYMKMLNTVIHEVSHIIAAKVTGGKGHSITLNADNSGLAEVSSPSWFGRVLTGYAGYTGSSAAALLLFYWLHIGYQAAVILFVLCLTFLSAFLWIRNLVGLLWSITFVMILGFMVYKQMFSLLWHISFLVSSIILIESIISSAYVLKISAKHPGEAGDASSLSRLTKIPAVVWGMVFFSQAIYTGYFIINNFIWR